METEHRLKEQIVRGLPGKIKIERDWGYNHVEVPVSTIRGTIIVKFTVSDAALRETALPAHVVAIIVQQTCSDVVRMVLDSA